MMRRIFIAINLPENVKKRLFDFRQKWEHLPVRWTKKDSLHLTLVFIGYADEEEVYEVCRLAKEVAQRFEPFDINFERILYGPPNKPPRMIWLQGKASEQQSKLKHDLDDALTSSGVLHSFRAETRPFSPHITLARIKTQDWRRVPDLPPNVQQPLEEDFKAIVPVSSIEVMESELKSDGSEYLVLESCPFGSGF